MIIDQLSKETFISLQEDVLPYNLKIHINLFIYLYNNTVPKPTNSRVVSENIL